MRLEMLEENQIRKIYVENMVFDFPDDERKPLSMIMEGIARGTYECMGFLDDGECRGYAFFIRTGGHYLLDYLAVAAPFRNRGIGAELLARLAEHYQDAESVIVEVENPAYAASGDEARLRERRYAFYLRNGYADTQVCTKVFGVPYRVLQMTAGAERLSVPEVKRLYEAHYRGILTGEQYAEMVEIF